MRQLGECAGQILHTSTRLAFTPQIVGADRATCTDVVAEALEEGALFAAAVGQLNQGLDEALEQLVAAEALSSR